MEPVGEGPVGEGCRWATFAGAVWAPQHSALVYGPERLEHLPDLTSLAPHERLPEILVVPREKTPTGAA